jgi:hypothetical protein
MLMCTLHWQVLGEDLVLVSGQQDRMQRGADTWAHPVSYDKLVRSKTGPGLDSVAPFGNGLLPAGV